MHGEMSEANSEEIPVGIVAKISMYLRSRPPGIVVLVGFEALSAIIFSLAFLGYYVDPTIQMDYETFIYFIGGWMVALSLVYGLWQRRSWAWALRLIVSLVGLVVLWPNLFMLIPESNVRTYTIAYVGHFVAIISYLLRPQVKAFFSIQAVVESGQKVRARLPFIDFTRGIVMVLMAWDHVSVFWDHRHRGSEGLLILPPNLAEGFKFRPEFSNFTQFLARFITHCCAPTFIFLAGTALALSTMKRLARGESQREITFQIIQRGVVLLLLEIFVIAPAFDLPLLYFGVLACIGMSFIIFSVLRRAPPLAILVLSVLIILGQPFLDLSGLYPQQPVANIYWYFKVILYQPNFDGTPYVGLYPILPWLGVMGLGWCFGVFLTSYNRTKIEQLSRPLVVAGGAALGLWFVVRLVNDYGNFLPRLGTTENTLQDWLFMGKYPPSLAFLLWTLGGMCFFLALGLFLQNRIQFTQGITGVLITFGRVPLFFYCTHLWLYRLWPEWMTIFQAQPYLSHNLGIVWAAIFWVNELFILWRLCLWYEALKRRHPHSLLRYI